ADPPGALQLRDKFRKAALARTADSPPRIGHVHSGVLLVVMTADLSEQLFCAGCEARSSNSPIEHGEGVGFAEVPELGERWPDSHLAHTGSERRVTDHRDTRGQAYQLTGLR